MVSPVTRRMSPGASIVAPRTLTAKSPVRSIRGKKKTATKRKTTRKSPARKKTTTKRKTTRKSPARKKTRKSPAKRKTTTKRKTTKSKAPKTPKKATGGSPWTQFIVDHKGEGLSFKELSPLYRKQDYVKLSPGSRRRYRTKK